MDVLKQFQISSLDIYMFLTTLTGNKLKQEFSLMTGVVTGSGSLNAPHLAPHTGHWDPPLRARHCWERHDPLW